MKSTGGRVKRWAIALAVIVFILTLSSVWIVRAVAQDQQTQDQQTLAEKLLIILKQNHQITQEQYDELLQEAQKEKAARKAAVAKAVKTETVQAAKEYKATHPLDVHASWKHHEIYFESNNGNFTMHVGGYAEVDFGGANLNDRLSDAIPKLEGYGAEVRRVRPAIEGTLYGDIDYKVQIDFAGGTTTIDDLYMTYRGFPCFANIRVGHQKEPFSLEELTSDQWLEFTERSLANAFVTTNQYADRNTGIQIFNTEFDQRMTWAVGGFMQQDNASGNSFQDYNNVNIAARATYLPWYADNGCQLVHLGLGFRHLFRTDNTDNFSSTSAAELDFLNKPEWHLGQNTINTGDIAAQGVNIINPEVAVVYGPFSVQGEYFDSFLDNARMYYFTGTTQTVGALSNPNLDGYYVMASWFLTGEHRNYDRNTGVFGRPIPFCNFSPSAGTLGAWELAVRYSNIDLNDKSIQGGAENDWTGSLIWYLNPNFRWMFDYVHAHIDGSLVSSGSVAGHGTMLQNGDANIFDTRFQISF